jgi:acyl-CoA synthetase (AMP-forming)/AMP-acid ligase II
MELKIVDSDSGKEVKRGDVGEVWVRGGQVMKGYWRMDDETKKSINAEGWFRTGDAAYQDENDYVYIYDRVKDMIVSGGENVYPAEVENALMKHPGIADVAVIGVPDGAQGDRGEEARRRGDRGVDPHLRQGTARRIQVPEVGRLDRRTSA